MRQLRRLAGLGFLPAAAAAHVPAETVDTVALPWTFEPWVLALLSVSLVLYGVGLVRLWGQAGAGRGIRGAHAASFGAGWLAVAVALVSPLDGLGARLFSAHMVQHELLMAVAAPLLVIGRPLAVWTWALPPSARRLAGRWTRQPVLARAWDGLTDPLVAWALHGVVLWGWHMPAMFEWALRSGGMHTLQHSSFLLSALLFWWAPLAGTSRAGRGASMFYLLSTMVHTGALGALLTFSPTVWYPSYGDAAASLGFDPVEDQQLGGLVMWVPAGLAYLFAGLAVAARAIGEGPKARAAALPPAV
jgi:putative membrane protein